MAELNFEKVKAVYVELCAERDKAVTEALTHKDEEIAQRLELLKPNLEQVVINDLTEEASKPYAHDIELFEKALEPDVEQPVAEQPVEEVKSE